MSPNEPPSEETIAATDELFKEQSVPSQQASDDESQSEEGTAPALDPVQKPPSPIQDYVRELQQEYEEQEEEGKL
jgi:hypothetical protein